MTCMYPRACAHNGGCVAQPPCAPAPARILPTMACDCGSPLEPGDDFCSLACEEAAQAADQQAIEDAHGVY